MLWPCAHTHVHPFRADATPGEAAAAASRDGAHHYEGRGRWALQRAVEGK